MPCRMSSKIVALNRVVDEIFVVVRDWSLGGVFLCRHPAFSRYPLVGGAVIFGAFLSPLRGFALDFLETHPYSVRSILAPLRG